MANGSSNISRMRRPAGPVRQADVAAGRAVAAVQAVELTDHAPHRAKGTAVPQFAVRPPARPATTRRRHRFLLLTFTVMLMLPVCLTGFYLTERAADQYASHVAFSVRSEEQSSAIELLGGMTELSGSSSSDTDILFAYLSSQELVARVDQEVDLRAIWSRVPAGQDPIFTFDPEGTIEALQDHWARKISIVYDSSTGLIDLRVLAFDPQDAQRTAQAILEACAAMINSLSRTAQEDSIRFTQEELERAVVRLKTARRAITQFRNRTQVVDPSIDTQNQMGLLVTLQEQLAEALISSDLLADTTRKNDPRVTQAQRRIDVINARIAAERRNLGLGKEGGSGEAFASLVGEYEGLIVDREFAETAYTAALAAHDAALAEVRKQSRYLAAHVKPTLAEMAEYPRRLTILAVLAVFCFFGWSIFCLVFYSLRDRS
ncbi:MAG: capsule biosynthesis protein [Sulfitobacter sp.]